MKRRAAGILKDALALSVEAREALASQLRDSLDPEAGQSLARASGSAPARSLSAIPPTADYATKVFSWRLNPSPARRLRP